MKRTNYAYVATCYGKTVGLLVIAGALGCMLGKIFGSYALSTLITAAVFLGSIIALTIIVPRMMKKKMEESALAMEKEFPQKGFSYQQKFTANNGIFYIDIGGRLGVVWKNNPSEFYLADLSSLTDIRTHDGKQIRGTSLVSCQFKLDGKKFKIYTLRVSSGQLSMKSREVLEAISKADKLCELLNMAKQAAQGSKTAR